MSRPTQVQCDVCPAIKRDANKWYVAMVSDREFVVTTFRENPPSPNFETEILDLCGRQCVLKRLNSWMEAREGA